MECFKPSLFLSSDYYLGEVAWITDDSLIAVWMTREQTYVSYSLCSPSTRRVSQWQCQDVSSTIKALRARY